MKVNHEQLKKIIKTSYEKRIPLMVTGAIGIGKSTLGSETAKEIAKEQKLEFSDDNHYNDKTRFNFIDIRLSQLDPSDLRGLPNFDHDTKTTKWFAPNWLPHSGQGMIFFDEINLAPPSIQGVCYQLILDRKVGDYKLPDGYSIIAAGNRLEDRANIFDLPAPLANRFIHCELENPTIDAWSDWAMKSGIDGRIISFLNFRSTYLYKFDDKNQSKAFPSPRMWATTSKLIAGLSHRKEIELMASLAIGDGVAIEFATFVDMQSKVDIHEILDSPQTYKFPEAVDKKYAIISAIAENYKDHKDTLPKIMNLSLYIDVEYGAMMLKMCRHLYDTSEEAFVERALKVKEAKKVIDKYGKYLL